MVVNILTSECNKIVIFFWQMHEIVFSLYLHYKSAIIKLMTVPVLYGDIKT